MEEIKFEVEEVVSKHVTPILTDKQLISLFENVVREYREKLGHNVDSVRVYRIEVHAEITEREEWGTASFPERIEIQVKPSDDEGDSS